MKIEEKIRLRAYELFLADKDRTSQRDLDDWLAAERQVLAETPGNISPCHGTGPGRPDPVTVMAERVGPSVAAICGVHPGGQSGEVVGTGLFISLRGRACVLTAQHVAAKKDALLASGDRRFDSLAHSVAEGEAPARILSRYLTEPPPRDLALALADRDRITPGDPRLLPEGLIEAEPEDGDFFVLGYPAQDSRFSAFANGTVSEALPFLTHKTLSNDVYFDSSLHFAISYPYPEPMQPPTDYCGRPRALPDPHGVSGAPVWVIDGPGKPQSARVVGVVQRHDPVHQALVVTRGSVVIEFLRRVHRQFADL